MEIVIHNLLEDFREVEQSVLDLACDFKPKAIYVSDTNMLLETSEIDDPLVPFEERKARPIKIWKHLVDEGIDPREIAVYCNLKFDRRFPKPSKFNLFVVGIMIMRNLLREIIGILFSINHYKKDGMIHPTILLI